MHAIAAQYALLIIRNLVSVEALTLYLKARGHSALLPRILSLVQKAPSSAAVVTVAATEGATAHKDAIARSLAQLGIKEGGYTLVVDPKIVGGYTVLSGSTLIDSSYRTSLVSIYHRTINHS